MTSNYGRFEWTYCPICGLELGEADDGESLRPHCEPCNRFYYSNPVPAACCFLTNDQGELLLVQRSVEPRKGMWTLPGGFIETGETTEEAALRELAEETGLTGKGLSLMGVSSFPSQHSAGIIVLGYTVDKWHGEMRPDTDAMDLGFFSSGKRPPIAFEVHQQLLVIYDNLRAEQAH